MEKTKLYILIPKKHRTLRSANIDSLTLFQKVFLLESIMATEDMAIFQMDKMLKYIEVKTITNT